MRKCGVFFSDANTLITTIEAHGIIRVARSLVMVQN